MMHLLARYPLLSSPRMLSALAAVAALAAGVLLGTQDASAGIVIHSGPRR